MLNTFEDIFIIQLGKNYLNLTHYLGQKIYIKVIKTAHRRSFFKKLVSQEIVVNCQCCNEKLGAILEYAQIDSGYSSQF